MLDADIQIRQIVGMIVSLEKFLTDAEERGNDFFLGLLEKQHVRMKALFERRVVRSSQLSDYRSLISLLDRSYQVNRGHQAYEQET